MIWQAPAVTVAVSGVLVAATFGYDVPDVARAVVTAVGAVFVFAMTLAVERYRMIQLRRRKDMAELERRLAPLGVEPIVWDVSQIVEEVKAGRFDVRGLLLYRWEGFKFLRALMYAITGLLVVLSGISIADAAGAGIIS